MLLRGSGNARLLAGALLGVGVVAQATDPVRPNIVLVLADDLGWGDVGFNAAPAQQTNVLTRLRTPCLDRLARGGAVLTARYAAAPVSAPSRASLLSGRVQGACSLRDNCFDQPLAETNTLASVLHGVGYTTWAVGKWGIGGGGESRKPRSAHPLDRGFDYFYGFLDHLAGHTYYHYDGHLGAAYMGVTENRTRVTRQAVGIYSTDLYFAKAKQLVARHAAANSAQPFFLYLAINTIHGSGRSDDSLVCKKSLHVPGRPFPADGLAWPLAPEPRAARNTWIDPAYRGLPEPAARYGTAITRFDAAFGDFLALLDRLHLAENTLIVFTSDNGAADEYGADPKYFQSNGPFDGLKRDVYEGGMRVPALMRWPGRIAAGTVDRTPSQFHDWMATFAEAAGAAAPRESEGVSLLPRVGASTAPRRPSLVYTQYAVSPSSGGSGTYRAFAARKGHVRGWQQMVREGDYVALRTQFKRHPEVRLYNVVADPFEEHDLSHDPAQRARLARLTAILDARKRP